MRDCNARGEWIKFKFIDYKLVAESAETASGEIGGEILS